LEKRPVGEEEVETLIEDIKKDIRSSGEREVRSRLIGEVIMKRLRRVDEVAFIRFASVYRRFEDITEFSEEVDKLAKD
jgi:transcriptional repressor NrdR